MFDGKEELDLTMKRNKLDLLDLLSSEKNVYTVTNVRLIDTICTFLLLLLHGGIN